VRLGLFTDMMEGELTSWTVHTPPASSAPRDVTPATGNSRKPRPQLSVFE